MTNSPNLDNQLIVSISKYFLQVSVITCWSKCCLNTIICQQFTTTPGSQCPDHCTNAEKYSRKMSSCWNPLENHNFHFQSSIMEGSRLSQVRYSAWTVWCMLHWTLLLSVQHCWGFCECLVILPVLSIEILDDREMWWAVTRSQWWPSLCSRHESENDEPAPQSPLNHPTVKSWQWNSLSNLF